MNDVTAETYRCCAVTDDLARGINAEHKEACAAITRSLQYAMAAGDLVIEAKARVKHEGEQWLSWLSKHCAMSERSAQVYMKRPEGSWNA